MVKNAIKNAQLIRLLMEIFAKILPQLLILTFVILKDISTTKLTSTMLNQHLIRQQIISIHNYLK